MATTTKQQAVTADVASMIDKSKQTFCTTIEEPRDEEDPLAGQDGSTSTDRHDMRVLGKKQVLKRNFRFGSMLAFSSTVMMSWEFLLPIFTFAVTDGGTAGLIWGFAIACCGLLFVYASMAEAASMAPTAGGQYHYVSEFAPLKVQKFFSYIVGWLTAIAWQFALINSCFVTGLFIQGLLVMNKDDYVWHNWHGTVLALTGILFTIIANTLLASRLSVISTVLLILHSSGFLVVVIVLWATAPIGNPRTVLTEFTNSGGWSSTGAATLIGLLTPLSDLIGYDCSFHMSEEVRDASLTLPRAMMASVYLNFTLCTLLAITLAFTLGSIDDILSTPTRQPFIELFYNATQSRAATTAMVAMVAALLIGGAITEVATTSRQIWSFARDGGLPFSGWLSQVSPRWNIPLRSVCVSVLVGSIFLCINLGSSNALNAFLSLGCLAIISSYYITISCILWRRIKGPPLPSRRWSLGRYGLAINILSLTFMTPVLCILCFPLVVPVTPETVNWAPVMFVGIISVALTFYVFKGRHVYKGPVVLVKRID